MTEKSEKSHALIKKCGKRENLDIFLLFFNYNNSNTNKTKIKINK